MMPADPVRGRRRADRRRTLGEIAWKYRTRSPLRDLPEGPDPFQTAPKRLLRRVGDGTGSGSSSPSRLHRMQPTTSAGPRRWTRPCAGPTSTPPAPAEGDRSRGEPDGHTTGRSRGGLSTEVHLPSGARARPRALVLTAGQACDAPAFTTVMSAIRVPRPGPGRPRTRPDRVIADRACSARTIRSTCGNATSAWSSRSRSFAGTAQPGGGRGRPGARGRRPAKVINGRPPLPTGCARCGRRTPRGR